MSKEKNPGSNSFRFRDLHPHVFIGTASDRYAGWIGQIYTEERYRNKISIRAKTIGGQSLKDEVLPVESVGEYFDHFSVLELDFTFYRLLLDNDLSPTQNHHVLQSYKKHLGDDDKLIVKVPQVIYAQRVWKAGKFIENPDYLNPEIFTRQFYEPAVDLLGSSINGFIFEQEYQPKKDRTSSGEYAAALDQFLNKIPKDDRYHIETRTESLLSGPYFKVLEKHGVGQVLSHWTWLPRLKRQFDLSERTFLNSGNQCIIRLMTPLRMRYDQAYTKAYPFNKLINGMMSPQMIEDTVEIMLAAIDQGTRINIVINNRAGGNAPSIADKISEAFSNVYSR